MKACEAWRDSSIAFDESWDSGGPSEEPFHDPALGKRDQAAVGLRQLDYSQIGRCSVSSGFYADVALIVVEGDLEASSAHCG
jgi:hypothetical protein